MSYEDKQDSDAELELRKQISEAIKLINKQRRRGRVYSVIYTVVILGTLFMATVMALSGRYWFSLAFMAEVWLMYRLYLVNHLHTGLLFECLHHAQRALVETDERRIWHVRQLGRVVDMYNWTVKSPLVRSDRTKALLAVGPAADGKEEDDDDDT